MAVPRAIWKGHVSFGLVEIPVSLHSAEQTDKVKFSLIDRRDHAPVKYVRVNKTSGEEVPWSEIVKGYEVDDGQYVLLSKEELAAIHEESTKTVRITRFVDADEIPLAYWDHPYVLRPTRKQGNRAYALLRDVLEKTGKVGIAQVVLRTRQHLAALLPDGPLLTLVLLRYEEEFKPLEEFELPEDLEEAEPSPAELKMAEQLVESMTDEWDPSEYSDDFVQRVEALVKKKVKSGELGPIEDGEEETEADEEAQTPVIDLMPLLKQSVEKRGSNAGKSKAAKKTSKSGKKKSATKKRKTG